MFNEELINLQLMFKAGYKNKISMPDTSAANKEKYAGFIDMIERTISILKAASYSPRAVRAAMEDGKTLDGSLGHLDQYLFKVCRVVNPHVYRHFVDGETDYICIGNSCTCTEHGVVNYLQLTREWLSKSSVLVKLDDIEVKGDYVFK